MSKVVEGLILAEALLKHFEEDIKGTASGLAWYELVDLSHSYVLGRCDKATFVEHLEFTFGYDGEAEFDEVCEQAEDYYKKMSHILYGNHSLS